MNPKTKRHIKLLAERFEHQIHYDRHVICLSNFKNSIRIEENRKRKIEVSYNVDDVSTITNAVTPIELYDLLIKILSRFETEKVQFKSEQPIQLEEWIATECQRSTRILDLKRRIQRKNSDHVILGGNRLEAEYFKGVIILMDDLLWTPCNVVDFPLE